MAEAPAEKKLKLGEQIKNKKLKLKEQKLPANHSFKKRVALDVPKTNQDIYVSNKTNYKALLSKCKKLIDNGEKEITIHGLGAAISKTCNLALQLEEEYNGVLKLDITTSTVELIDDLEPLTDDADYEVNTRFNSAIHIRVFRTVDIGPLKYSEQPK